MKKITFLFLVLYSTFGFSQTYYSQNFNVGGLNGWTASDLNSDGLNWSVLNASTINSAFETGSLVSFSYDDNTNSAVTPNNLVTSPAINLTTVTSSNVYLFFDYQTASQWPAEHYAVYVTTSNTPSVITSSTPVFETTVANGNFTTKSIDLSAYIGQTVYVSFRHFNCNDQYFLVIDNVVLKSLATNDAQLVSAQLNKYALINTNNNVSFSVKNVGLNAITNLSLNWNDGISDHVISIPTNIAIGASATVNHTVPLNYTSVVEKNIALSITAVNNATDPDITNNSSTLKFNTLSQASPKKVLFEEGTGTWCQWCPRGAVAMDYMETTYPNEFIGVAVHNGDPMTVAAYNTGAAFSSFPGMNVDRVEKGIDVSQDDMESNLNTRKLLATPVSLNATGNVSGSNVTINAIATFRTVFSNANLRLGVIISEDNVSGTTSGYNQANAYSGGANGAMGGYESLPNPVPASQMVYDHVGRALLGGYNGQSGSVPTSITDGQVVNYTFSYVVPSTSNISNLKAVIVLIDQTTGEIINSNRVSLNALSIADNELNSSIKIFPNPTTSFVNISDLKGGNYKITLFDLLGREVLSKDVNIVENQIYQFSLKDISSGEYILNIASGASSFSKHLLVK